jgi:two-component system alkaline phosphatase synthesis response regulator PhoP
VKTILIADDEAHLRLLVRKTLEVEDYRLLEAPDGDGALALARKERPDLVILDWMMPGRTGLDVLRALREDPGTAATPVIMLTARSQKDDRAEAERLGVRGYLVKPFSPLELLQLVEQVVEDGAA